MSVSVSVGASASPTLLERRALSSVASDGVQPLPAAGFAVEVRVPGTGAAGEFVAVRPAAGLVVAGPGAVVLIVPPAVGAGMLVVGAVVGAALVVVPVLEQPARAAAATAATTSGVRAFTIFFSPERPIPHPVMRRMVISMLARHARRITETCQGVVGGEVPADAMITRIGCR